MTGDDKPKGHNRYVLLLHRSILLVYFFVKVHFYCSMRQYIITYCSKMSTFTVPAGTDPGVSKGEGACYCNIFKS